MYGDRSRQVLLLVMVRGSTWIPSQGDIHVLYPTSCMPIVVIFCPGDESIVALLVKEAHCMVNTTDSTGRTALHWAAACGHAHLCSLLLGVYVPAMS